MILLQGKLLNYVLLHFGFQVFDGNVPELGHSLVLVGVQDGVHRVTQGVDLKWEMLEMD